jgi:excisionase family DNA binding protein
MKSNSSAPPRRLLTERRAAEYLDLSPRTLEKWRAEKSFDGPRFVRVGTRNVRYAIDDLDEWISARRRRSTSDPGLGAEAQPSA